MLAQSRCHLSGYNKSSHLSEHDKVCFNGSTDVKMIPGSVHALVVIRPDDGKQSL